MQSLVRFPNSLAFGSELGLHYPYRRGIFLSTLPARPIWTAHGQGGAYWIAPHLRKPHAQARLFFTHWSCRLHSIFILRQNATFAGGRYCSWISHFPAFRFLTGSNFVFSAQRSAIFVRICAGIVVGFVNRLDFIFSRTYLDDTIVQLTHVPL